MDRPDKSGNRIDEVRIRLSRTAEAASNTEERELETRPAPLTDEERSKRRGRRLAPLLVAVLALAIFAVFYAVYVRIMIPKFDPGVVPTPAETRRKRDEDLKELERLLKEKNMPAAPIPAAPAGTKPRPAPQATPAAP